MNYTKDKLYKKWNKINTSSVIEYMKLCINNIKL